MSVSLSVHGILKCAALTLILITGTGVASEETQLELRVWESKAGTKVQASLVFAIYYLKPPCIRVHKCYPCAGERSACNLWLRYERKAILRRESHPGIPALDCIISDHHYMVSYSFVCAGKRRI